MYENEGYETIDIIEIIKVLKKRIILLIIVPFIFAIIGAVLSKYFIIPVFEASTTIIVRQSNDSNQAISQGDVNLSKSLIYTYAQMAKSDTVLSNTRNILNIDKLKSETISVLPIDDTQILKIEVQNADPKLATDIANTLVQQFTLEVVRITKADNVAVVDYAKIPEKPIKPNMILNTAIAGILGELMILFIAFLAEYLDNTVKTDKDIEKYLKVSLVGTIPNFNQGGKQGYEYGKVYGERTAEVSVGGRI